MSDTVYTKIDSDSFIRLHPDENGFYDYLVIDDEGSRFLLEEGGKGKYNPSFTKVPK